MLNSYRCYHSCGNYNGNHPMEITILNVFNLEFGFYSSMHLWDYIAFIHSNSEIVLHDYV